MAKNTKMVEVVSDGSEKFLVELVERFSVKRAIEWLRVKFPSFDTSRAEELACDATKNEKEYFATAELLGYVTKLNASASDDSNKPILVAAIKMRKDLTERTSRLVQFNYAKKLLQNAIAKGAQGVSGLPSQGLFFFYDKDGFFRLSLVTGEVEKRRFKYNEAKRQSFYIEPLAANNIVKRRLSPPIKTFAELKDVFSVEQLTKEFYTKLFDWYTWALTPKVNVSFPNDLDDDKDDRKYNNEAIIRMITRLMFTWFIRQRKLVPDVLFDREDLKDVLKNFDPDSMEQDNYYRCILQNLFFATFNCQPEKRRFIHIFHGKSDEQRVTTLYRYEREFRDAESFKALMKKVPFLNCALFDCLDKIERPEDGGHELYFDGFSGRGTKYQAFVPNGLFFDGERGIINLFNRYEFTVNENNADDSDVALDPELLGKVFENLLGAFNPETQETARNATGSFYTPREIVDYMVEESLKNYIQVKVKGAIERSEIAERSVGLREQWKSKLDDLFDRNKAAEGAETLFSSKERGEILDALYNCKILDPACGSGAFPMGILHCMVRLLTRLDPQSISIREQLLKRYREDKATADQDEIEELESRLKEGQHYPDYERKLYLIENCIYGVDIQPIATQISKLRFFISLLCDQLRSSYDPDAENFGLLSLPNLEAKFVCANTLISLPDIEGELKLGDVKELREKLQDNRHKIFRARSTKTKEKYKAKDLETRDKIRETVRDTLSKPDEDVIAKCRAEIEDAKKRREAVAAPDWVEKEVLVPQQDGLGLPGFDDGPKVAAKQKRKVDLNASERDKIDAEIAWAEQKIKDELKKAESSNVSKATQYAQMVAGWDPYDQNASSKFFDAEWMFNIKDGFDVVIGNPPYVKLETIKEQSRLLETVGYEVFEKRSDLYCIFTERGVDLLADGGVISYIMSNKWMQAEYGKPLRRLMRKYRILSLIDFGDIQIFDGATTYPCVFCMSKDSPAAELDTLALRSFSSDSFRDDVKRSLKRFPSDKLTDDAWVIELGELELLEKIWQHAISLSDYVGGEAYYGIKPGATEAFIIPSDVANNLIKEHQSSKKILVPILRGRDMECWFSRFTGWYMIGTFPALNLDINDYPAIKRFLLAYGKKRLEQSGEKGSRKKTSNKWFETQDQIAYYRIFKQPKIMYQKFQVKPCFIYDTKGLYCNDSMWIIPTKEVGLVGVLNSKMGWWLISKYCTQIQSGYQLIWQYLSKIPVPKKLPAELGELVDKIITAKKKDPEADTSAWEGEIDELVYDLYGLTEEERKIVEGGSRGARALPTKGGRARSPSAPQSGDNENALGGDCGGQGLTALPVPESEIEEELE